MISHAFFHEATCCCVCLAPWPWRFRSFLRAKNQRLGTSSRGTQVQSKNHPLGGFEVWCFQDLQVKRQSKVNTIRWNLEKTWKKIEKSTFESLRDLKNICLWISYAETRVFGCAAASGQQQNMQIRVVPKHFITSLQLLDLIALKFVRMCIFQRSRGRWVVGRVRASQCFGRASDLLFHKWCCISINFIHFCCSSHPFTAFWGKGIIVALLVCRERLRKDSSFADYLDRLYLCLLFCI